MWDLYIYILYIGFHELIYIYIILFIFVGLYVSHVFGLNFIVDVLHILRIYWFICQFCVFPICIESVRHFESHNECFGYMNLDEFRPIFLSTLPRVRQIYPSKVENGKSSHFYCGVRGIGSTNPQRNSKDLVWHCSTDSEFLRFLSFVLFQFSRLARSWAVILRYLRPADAFLGIEGGAWRVERGETRKHQHECL